MDEIPDMQETRNLRIRFEKPNEDENQEEGTLIASDLNTYRLGRLMGKGAFAKVFSCVDVNSGCLYAVKQYFGVAPQYESQALKILNTIPHFGVPQLKETFTFEGKYYMIMYLIAGCSIESLLLNCKLQTDYIPVIPVQLMKTILRQLLVTCRFIHQRGIAHQDIKIDNIYVMDGSRLVLLDFGQAFIMQDKDYLKQAQQLGNIAFLPPEVLINTQIVGNSFQDANNMTMTCEAQERISQLIRNNKSFGNFSKSKSFCDELKIPKYNHVQTLFDKSRHTVQENKVSQPTKVWIQALTRLFKFSSCNQDFANLTQVIKENTAFIQQQFEYSDEYPQQQELQNIAIDLAVEELQKEQIHIFNKKLAIDSWGVGINALILLLGEYPFRGLQQYETIPAIQILSECIKQQLDQTLQNMVGMNCDFSFYEQMISQNKKIQYKIAPGPLPQNIPSDLFLLIAGLLYPNPQIRLSITETLGCPFIEAYQTYIEEQANLNKQMQPSEKFEPITASMSRMDKLRESSTTIATMASNFSNYEDDTKNIIKEETLFNIENCPIMEDSNVDSDSY